MCSWTDQALLTTFFYTKTNFYRPPTKLWEGNILHVCLSVCLSTGGPNVTITQDVLNLTVQPSPVLPPPRHLTYPPQHPPLDITPETPLDLAQPPARAIRWQSLETFSNLFIWGPPVRDICWWPLKLKRIRFPSGQHASYWKTFFS